MAFSKYLYFISSGGLYQGCPGVRVTGVYIGPSLDKKAANVHMTYKDKKTIYYQSVESGAINRGVYSIRLDGTNKKLLSNNAGTNTAAFSRNLNYFINTYSTTEIPPIYSLYSAEGNMIKVIKDNSSLEGKLLNYSISPKEFSTININGNDLNMWMIKPLDFDEQKQSLSMKLGLKWVTSPWVLTERLWGMLSPTSAR